MTGARPSLAVVGEPEPAVLVLLGRVAALGFPVRLVRPGALGDGERPGDVVLVPHSPDSATLLTLVRRLVEGWVDLPVVIVGEGVEARELRELWRAGAADFLFLDEAETDLGEVLERVIARAAPRRLPPPALALVGDGTHGAAMPDEEPTTRISVQARAALAAAPPFAAREGARPHPIPAANVSNGGGTHAAAPSSPNATSSPSPTPSASPAPRPSPSPSPAPNAVARDLPLMDARLPELERLMEQDTCDLKEIEAFVTADPSLVVTVIRASNAAYYRSPKLITNLRDAVVRIGNRQVFALLLETLVQRSFQVTSPEGRKVISGCWRNATLTARLVRRLAEWTGLGRPEDVYVAGLLHNLGEMVLIWRAIEGSASGLTTRLEADGPRIAGTHESLGRIVATRWGLPPLVQILTGFHHTMRPGGRPDDEKLRLAVLATWALSRRVLGEYLPNQPPVEPEALFDEMGLPEPLRQRLNDECTAAMAGL